jgi:perosamine synthetase
MTRFLPPAGMPLEVSDFVAGLRGLLNPEADGICSAASFTGDAQVFGVSSGRAGLVVIFRALQRLLPGRRVVGIPAYTCYSVAAAAVRAGLTVYPLEMDPGTLELDYEEAKRVPYDRLLAVVTANLFGFPADVERLRQYAEGSRAFIIDDAAQLLGTCTNGQLLHSRAHVRVYSLARGKALPVGGGLIVAPQEEIAAAIRQELEHVASLSLAGELVIYAELLGISILFRPWLYWVPNALPFLKLGVTEFAPGFSITRMARVSAGMLPRKLTQLKAMTAARAVKAAYLRAGLEGVGAFCSPKAPAGCIPSYIRFPVLAKDQQARDWAVQELRKAGIGASAYYPAALCDVPEVRPHLAPGAMHRPQAEQLARTVLTLPLHPMVREKDLQRALDILTKYPN